MPRSLADELRARGFDDKQIATAKLPDGTLLSECEATSKQSDRWGQYRSKWELLYSLYLDDEQRAGKVTRWQYEPIRLRLTDPSRDADGKAVRPIFYTPDFLVDRPMHAKFQLVEIKGFRRTKDVNRYKLARDKFRYWFDFVMVSRTSSGWTIIM